MRGTAWGKRSLVLLDKKPTPGRYTLVTVFSSRPYVLKELEQLPWLQLIACATS